MFCHLGLVDPKNKPLVNKGFSRKFECVAKLSILRVIGYLKEADIYSSYSN